MPNPNSAHAMGFTGTPVTELATEAGTAQTFTLTPNQLNVEATTGDGSSKMTITLPSAGECMGQIFFFYYKSDGGSDVDVNSIDGTNIDKTYADAGDFLVLVSNGIRWLEIGELDQ